MSFLCLTSCLAQPVLCSLAQCPSKIDSAHILSEAEQSATSGKLLLELPGVITERARMSELPSAELKARKMSVPVTSVDCGVLEDHNNHMKKEIAYPLQQPPLQEVTGPG